MKKVLMVLLLLASGSADARENAMVHMHSFSNISCGQWTESQKEMWLRQTYIYWFRGFVSGYNFGSELYEVTNNRLPDNPTLALYVDKFCRENPLQDFISAAFPLVKELRSTVQ
jgi:hypothetical protein